MLCSSWLRLLDHRPEGPLPPWAVHELEGSSYPFSTPQAEPYSTCFVGLRQSLVGSMLKNVSLQCHSEPSEESRSEKTRKRDSSSVAAATASPGHKRGTRLCSVRSEEHTSELQSRLHLV